MLAAALDAASADAADTAGVRQGSVLLCCSVLACPAWSPARLAASGLRLPFSAGTGVSCRESADELLLVSLWKDFLAAAAADFARSWVCRQDRSVQVAWYTY